MAAYMHAWYIAIYIECYIYTYAIIGCTCPCIYTCILLLEKHLDFDLASKLTRLGPPFLLLHGALHGHRLGRVWVRVIGLKQNADY